MRNLLPAYVEVVRQIHSSMVRMLNTNSAQGLKLGLGTQQVGDITYQLGPLSRSEIMDEFNGLKQVVFRSMRDMCVNLSAGSNVAYT